MKGKLEIAVGADFTRDYLSRRALPQFYETETGRQGSRRLGDKETRRLGEDHRMEDP